MPKVSVIIGVYNGEKFIQESARSVINQTFTDWELIVVDDGSGDNTCNKVKEIHDARLNLIRLDRNSGCPAVPRNVGIKAAEGKYIAFLDADDVLLPHSLEDLMAVFNKFPETNLVYGKYICFDENGEWGAPLPRKGYSGKIFRRLLKGNLISIGSMMTRKDVLEKVGLFNEDKGLIIGEDAELFLRISYHYKVTFLDKVIRRYRMHPLSVTVLHREDIGWRGIKILESIFSVLDIPEKQKKATLSYHYAIMARAYLKQQRYDLFEKYTLYSLELCFNCKAALAWFLYVILGGRMCSWLINFYKGTKLGKQ